MEVFYERLTPDELSERIKQAPVAYLPLGTLEWHGPHMPLGADMIQPREFFVELARRVGGVVLPSLFMGPDEVFEKDGRKFYGMDNNDLVPGRPLQLEGSAYWIDERLFAGYLDAIVAQLSRVGFKVIVGHGHGPSTTSFLVHAEELEMKHGVKLFTMWGLFDDREKGFMIDHGAGNETSIMLAEKPELVKMQNLPENMKEWPLGTAGDDPRQFASAEAGKKIVEANLEAMEHAVREALDKIRRRG
jgi:creatinine amidohydrolase